uniref:Glutaminyl-peptide cyclotransferase n=1 Tax=Corethrella appendiculata TaxID=1370023 RepID=U5ERI0_9DIPT
MLIQGLYLIFLVIIISGNISGGNDDKLRAKRENHQPIDFQPNKVTEIAKLSNMDNFNKILDNILVPRVVGTTGHENVKNYIADSLRQLSWHVEFDEFESNVPIFNRLTFSNIIAKLNPNAERYLVLACHYDSKYFKEFDFVAATDSAVPCAMMLNLAFVLNKYLQQKKTDNSLSIMFIFFDGEEAFLNWSAEDSIYGARNLAKKWETEGFLPRIDMLVLLDLLGAPDPTFYSFFTNTERNYVRLYFAEDKLEKGGHLERYSYSGVSPNSRTVRYFQPQSVSAHIEDDHLPFLQRNVPILHLITSPFPNVWHKKEDDREAIDFVTVDNLNKIFRVFVAEYLHLNI